MTLKRKSPSGLGVNMLDFYVLEKECEIQSRYYVPFQTLVKMLQPLIHPAIG